MKKIIIAVSVIATLVMSGCRPETRNQMLGIPDNAILLTTEGFTDANAKTSVSGTSVYWVNDDDIDFYVGTGNKQPKKVVVSAEGYAYVASALTGDGVIRGYYPAGIATENHTTDNPRVTLPAEYSCSVNGGRQVIALPMVGRADAGATTIKFKHLTAAVNVMLKNSLTSDLYIDSITITSDNYQLCSPTGFTIDLTAENMGNNLVSTTIGNRKVKLTLPENLSVAAGSSNMEFQVPIRPTGGNPNISTEDHFTIDVYCHSDTKRYHYNYRPDAAVPALSRNMMLTAMVDLNTSGHMVEVVEPTYRAVDMSKVSTTPFTVQEGDTLYGKCTKYNLQLVIPAQVQAVVFRGLELTSATVKVEGTSTINLEGENNVAATMNRPAVFVTAGGTLTIHGIGSLSATGGLNAAGIGCGPVSDSTYNRCGNIIISGGSITAKGGSGAAGIGTGNNEKNTCGTITIKNTVTSVTATKGSGATESIGRGNASSNCGTVTKEDGANVTEN